MQKKETNESKTPNFIIRKIRRKTSTQGKHQIEFNSPHSETNSEKGQLSPSYNISHRVFSPEKENEIMKDQFTNKAVFSPKAKLDVLKVHLDKSKNDGEQIKRIELKPLKQEQEKNKFEAEILKKEKPKYLESLNLMKERLQVLCLKNNSHLNNKVSAEAKLKQNFIIQNKFQAEYEHNIDPDQMTYEELLELGERIGVVCKGLPTELSQTLPKIEIQTSNDEKCPVCYSNYEQGETKTQIFNCKHEFHFECLQSWLAMEKICPICKQEIEFGQPGEKDVSAFEMI